MSDTICAVATAAGVGAVGILRLSGPKVLSLLADVTRVRNVKPRRMHTTFVRDPVSGEQIDHVMVCFMPGPKSYTGEDVLEVYAHGGIRNMQRLLDFFVRMGARQAEPGEFTRRAFVNGRMDLTQAEAVAEVIAARSERALRNAQALLGGELGRRVRALREKAIVLAADLEACLDFAEDIESPVSADALERTHRELIEAVDTLAGSYQRGQRLNGVSVALVGPVNAGKSSLFNALLASKRALVSEQAGTTRDYLEATVEWDGLCVTLIDTAGHRDVEAMSELERAGVALADERVQRCDLVLFIVDVNDEKLQTLLCEASVEALEQRWHVPVIVVANKVDLFSDSAARAGALETGERRVVATSAMSGEGLTELREAVVATLFPDESAHQSETVQVTQARQRDALLVAKSEFEQGLLALAQKNAPEIVVEHTRAALTALGSITGEAFCEDVLSSIFSRFCVGK